MSQLIKTVLLSCFCFFLTTSCCRAADWYIGTGLGKSNLNYDTNKQVQKYLDKNNYGQYVDALSTIGMPLVIEDDFTQTAKKIFIGNRFAKNWRVELTYKEYGTYTTSASISGEAAGDISVVPTSGEFEYEGEPIKVDYPHNANATAEVSGFAKGTAALEAKSTSISVLYDMFSWKRATTYMRFGVEHLSVKYTSTTIIDYDYSYQGTQEFELPVSGSGAAHKSESRTTNQKGYLPVFGLGTEYTLARNISVRGELERTGDPKSGGIYSDFYSISIIRKF